MTSDEIRNFIELKDQQIKESSTIHSVLKKNPVFIFIDDRQETFVANYIEKEKTVVYAHANPVKMLLFLISRKLGIDVFEDALIKDLEEAINNVLETYNLTLGEIHDRNIQNKISSDGSPKHQ